MINIAILGFGTIGSGVAKLVERNADAIAAELGDTVRVKYILDIRDFSGTPYAHKIVRDIGVISKDPEIDIVCEMMGGTKPALEYSLECLRAGKSVVTSNKEVVAKFGTVLCDTARENGVRYLYEASVGGGIPIIRTIKTAFAGCTVRRVDGILNGTTNYILTRMIKDNKSLEQALKEAQSLGYAEANPTADVDGHDACRKICILAALSFGKLVSSADVACEGIREIRLADTEIAAKFGGAVKLVASAELLSDETVDIKVSPCLVRANDPLSSVDDVYNAVRVTADTVGDTVLMGKGAGMFPTAGAVLSDIMDVARYIGAKQPEQEAMVWADSSVICDSNTVSDKYYAAVAQDSEKVLSDFAGAEILYEEDGLTAFVCPDISKQSFDFILKASGYDVLSSFRAI